MPNLETFSNFQDKPVVKKDEPAASRRIISFVETLERQRRQAEHPEQKERPKPFNIWVVAQRNYVFSLTHDLSFASSHQISETKGGRPCFFDVLRSHGDLTWGLEKAYDFSNDEFEGAMRLPEIVLLMGPPKDADFSPLDGYAAKFIRDSVREYLQYKLPPSSDTLKYSIGENLVVPFLNSFRFQKEKITKKNVLEYGIAFLEEFPNQLEVLLTAASQYLQTPDRQLLANAFSDEYLQGIFNSLKTFDEDTVEDDYELMFEPSDFKSLYSYSRYREKNADLVAGMDFESIKTELRATCVSLLAEYLDEHCQSFKTRADFQEWEMSLIEPIIISVSDNFAFNEFTLERGANLAITDFQMEDLSKLIDLVEKIKSNPASITPRKLLREKGSFYSSVESQIKERSTVTADTHQELEILNKIFADNNVTRVLDVGCGYGRITLPLIQSGLAVDGLDLNASFLEEIKSQLGTAATHHFEKGNVIDYASAVRERRYQSVIYTWHTILEAFGPGNLLKSLSSAWRVLDPGGILIFDQPTRENAGLEDGWYGHSPENNSPEYLAYIMTEEEISFMLRISGFEDVQITHWQTTPNAEYPEGLKKITVSAKKKQGTSYHAYFPG